MDVLNQIVEQLNKEEVRSFKLYSSALNRPDERKDLLLFDYMRTSGSSFKEEKAIKKLDYSAGEKNSYYRLKNRLMENLGDSLAMLHTHKHEKYKLLQYLQLFDICHSRNLFKVAASLPA